VTDIDAGTRTEALSAPVGWRGTPSPPPARRVDRPRWRDGRLLAGVLLLLVSVAVGARVLAAGDTTTPVVAVARALQPGHVVADGDLTVTRVRLTPGTARSYFPGATLPSLAGRVLARGAASGELLPVGAVAQARATPARLVPLRLGQGRHPDLAPGDRVDVYATAAVRPAGGTPTAAGDLCTTQLVLAGAEVVTGTGSEDAGGDTTVTVRVRPEDAPALVHAVEAGSVVVARSMPVGDEQGESPASPVQAIGGFPTATCGGRR